MNSKHKDSQENNKQICDLAAAEPGRPQDKGVCSSDGGVGVDQVEQASQAAGAVLTGGRTFKYFE